MFTFQQEGPWQTTTRGPTNIPEPCTEWLPRERSCVVDPQGAQSTVFTEVPYAPPGYTLSAPNAFLWGHWPLPLSSNGVTCGRRGALCAPQSTLRGSRALPLGAIPWALPWNISNALTCASEHSPFSLRGFHVGTRARLVVPAQSRTHPWETDHSLQAPK